MNKKLFILLTGITAIVTLVFVFTFLFKITNQIKTSPQSSPIPTPTIFIAPTEDLSQQGRGQEPEWFKQEEQKFLQENPILQRLPKNELPFFRIGYINETHLVVYAKTQDKQRDYLEAKKWLVENGVDIDAVIIEYK